MRNHPVIVAKSLQKVVSYDEAEALARASTDPECVKAIKEIDAHRAKASKHAKEQFNKRCTQMKMSPETLNDLITAFAVDVSLETWFIRRVNLTRAFDAPVPEDYHPENI